MSTRPALGRGERKAETRRALVEAASELFARQGMEATSMDEVAARVGLTKGAVYAHFRNKAHLVHEVLEAADAVVDGKGLFDPARPLAQAIAELGPDVAELLPKVPRRHVMLYLESFLFELRDAARLRRFVREVRQGRLAGGTELDEAALERGEPLLIPGRELMAIFEGLGIGLALMLAVDGEAISRDAIVRFFGALGYGLDNAEAVNALLSSRPST